MYVLQSRIADIFASGQFHSENVCFVLYLALHSTPDMFFFSFSFPSSIELRPGSGDDIPFLRGIYALHVRTSCDSRIRIHCVLSHRTYRTAVCEKNTFDAAIHHKC